MLISIYSFRLHFGFQQRLSTWWFCVEADLVDCALVGLTLGNYSLPFLNWWLGQCENAFNFTSFRQIYPLSFFRNNKERDTIMQQIISKNTNHFLFLEILVLIYRQIHKNDMPKQSHKCIYGNIVFSFICY